MFSLLVGLRHCTSRVISSTGNRRATFRARNELRHNNLGATRGLFSPVQFSYSKEDKDKTCKLFCI